MRLSLEINQYIKEHVGKLNPLRGMLIRWRDKARALERSAEYSIKICNLAKQLQAEFVHFVVEGKSCDETGMLMLSRESCVAWHAQLKSLAKGRPLPTLAAQKMVELLRSKMQSTNLQGSITLSSSEVKQLIELLS